MFSLRWLNVNVDWKFASGPWTELLSNVSVIIVSNKYLSFTKYQVDERNDQFLEENCICVCMHTEICDMLFTLIIPYFQRAG